MFLAMPPELGLNAHSSTIIADATLTWLRVTVPEVAPGTRTG